MSDFQDIKPVAAINNIAVIGAGNQGPKIALRCAVWGYRVRLHDKFPEVLAKAGETISGWLAEYPAADLAPEMTKEAVRAAIRVEEDLASALKKADLIIETVPERLDLKKEVLSQINFLAGPRPLLATNSSSLPCSLMAGAVDRPDRLFNVNFSHPQHPQDRLVELMKGRLTSTETILTAEAFIRSLNMVPVVTLKEIMGFSFNRTWRAVKKEVLHLVDQGYADPEDLDRAWMLEFGSPWGPFGLMDIIGLDTVRDIETQYFNDSGDEGDKPPKLLDNMIDSGRLGLKADQGFYSYPDPDYKNPAWLMKRGPWANELRTRLAAKENKK